MVFGVLFHVKRFSTRGARKPKKHVRANVLCALRFQYHGPRRSLYQNLGVIWGIGPPNYSPVVKAIFILHLSYLLLSLARDTTMDVAA